MLTWIAVRAFLGGAMSAVWKWLSNRSLAELACIALVLFGGFQTLRLRACEHHAAKVEARLVQMEKSRDDAIRQVAKDDAQIATLTGLIRKANDEESRRIAGDAHSLRVSGPGKSTCRPVAPAAPRGPVAPNSKPDAPGPALPPDDRAAVPWDWLTDRAQEHDQLRAEVQGWHDWYQMLIQNWPKDSK